MTEKELIVKLQELKNIKPDSDWVVFSRNRILNTPLTENKVAKPQRSWSIFDVLAPVFGGRKAAFAYSLAALLFVFAGIYSLVNISSLQKIQVANNSSVAALLAAEAELKNNFQIMSEKSKNLMEVIENEPQKVEGAIQETKVAVKNITDSIKKEPLLAKTFALEISKNRTYLNVVGSSDLKASSDDLYKIIDEQLMPDLEKSVTATWTAQQQKLLEEIKDLYNEGRYDLAFEKILMLNVSLNSNRAESVIGETSEVLENQTNEKPGEN